MKDKHLIIGVDVGNYNTKSQNTVIPSGYEGPFLEATILGGNERGNLKWNGLYYIHSSKRLPYLADKTKDDRCIILTLMSISKEILLRTEKEGMSHDEIQAAILLISSISLGAGLPFSDFKKKYVENLINYYKKYMAEGIEYEYMGYQFKFKMEHCSIYPQGGAAAFARCTKVTDTYKNYYIIDIGGYTVDVAHMEDNAPADDAFSLGMGIITMYDFIIQSIYTNYDLQIDAKIIEEILNDESTIIPDEVCNAIKKLVDAHAFSIINSIKQKGIMIASLPCIYIGGGSALLKKSLLASPVVNKNSMFFINDIKANAKGYAKLLTIELATAR